MTDESSATDLAHDHVERPHDPVRRLLLVALLVTVVGAGLSLVSVYRVDRFSAMDEATHIDYAWSIAHGRIPVSGAALSEKTLDAWACAGQPNIKRLPPCGSDAPASSFPGKGQQYNGFHPPVYYAITGLIARPLAAATHQDFIGVARSLSALWLVAAMWALYLTLRYWRLRWGYACLAAASLPLVPAVLHAGSTVTNDAAAALAGVAAVFALGRVVVYRNTGWLLPAIMAMAAASTKVLNAMGLLAVASALILLALLRGRTLGWRGVFGWVRVAVAIVIGTAIVYIGWSQVSRRHTVADWQNPILAVNQEPLVGLPFDEWLPTLASGFRLGSGYFLDPAVNSWAISAWAAAVSLLLSASALIGMAVFARYGARWALATALLLGCLAFPMVVQFQASHAYGTYFPNITPRYGLSLVPMAVAVLAAISDARSMRVTSTVIVCVGLLAVALSTIGLIPPTM